VLREAGPIIFGELCFLNISVMKLFSALFILQVLIDKYWVTDSCKRTSSWWNVFWVDLVHTYHKNGNYWSIKNLQKGSITVDLVQLVFDTLSSIHHIYSVKTLLTMHWITLQATSEHDI